MMESVENSHQRMSNGQKPGLCFKPLARLRKRVFKNGRSGVSPKTPGMHAELGSSAKKIGVSLGPDVVKPITKWRRICKCFIGLKMTKKNKVKYE